MPKTVKNVSGGITCKLSVATHTGCFTIALINVGDNSAPLVTIQAHASRKDPCNQLQMGRIKLDA